MFGRESAAIRSLRVITGAMLVTWLVLPLIPLAIWSFSRSWFFPDLLPSAWSTRAWDYALSDTSQVMDSLGITIVISLGATALSVLAGVPAGRALGLYNFPGQAARGADDPGPDHRAGHRRGAGHSRDLHHHGLTNTVAGVILVHLIPTLPYMVLVMAGIFSNYDPDIEDQARSLGASPLAVFWYITLPAIMPGVIVGALFAFLVSWSQYILTLLNRRGTGGDPAVAAVQLRNLGEERRDRRDQHDLHPAGDRHPGADRASPVGGAAAP